MNDFYFEYLKSPHWQAYRKSEYMRADYKCERCNVTGVSLHCHHLQYKDHAGKSILGRERGGIDTVVICEKCHQAAHNVPTQSLEERWEEWWGKR